MHTCTYMYIWSISIIVTCTYYVHVTTSCTYLLELRESHRYHCGHTNPARVSVDDVVIVHSTDKPRGFWKLGQVKETLVGQDGEIRGAVVQVAGRGRQPTLLHHPIQLLYPLEVSSPCRDLQPSADNPSHVQQATTTSDLPCSDASHYHKEQK